ncbi:MAG: TIR domain-containing protein [Anaerolineae bacterium]
MVIFISHEHTDDPFVNKLRTELHLRGFTTWVDHFDIPPGALWTQVIEQALAQSSMMLLVLSETALKSQHVSLEWGAFLGASKRIIPLRYRPCIMPMLLRTFQNLDFTTDDGFSAALNRLLDVLPAAGDDPPVILQGSFSDFPSTVVGIRGGGGQTGELIRKADGMTTDKLSFGQANIILPEHNKVIPFSVNQPMTVGRFDAATDFKPDIDLAPYGAVGRGVSRRHLLIANTTEGMTITDLNSSNGTYLSHRRIEANRPLVIRSKTLFRLGSFPLQIEYMLNHND